MQHSKQQFLVALLMNNDLKFYFPALTILADISFHVGFAIWKLEVTRIEWQIKLVYSLSFFSEVLEAFVLLIFTMYFMS